MFDISTNSIEPIKRQEKELRIFDDSTNAILDIKKVNIGSGSFEESSGIQIFHVIITTLDKTWN